jgi:hypothetical protein
MGKKSASPIILELGNHFWGLKYLNSLMQIRGGKNSDPGWKNNFLLNFIVKILFCKHYFIKGKDPEPDPDPDPYI